MIFRWIFLRLLFFFLVCVARFVNSKHVFSRVRALTLLICQCFRCHYAITTFQLQAHTSFRLAFHESAADFMHSPRHAWHFMILSSVQFEIFLRWSGAKSKFSFWFSIPFVCLKKGRWQIKTLCQCVSREKKFEFSLLRFAYFQHVLNNGICWWPYCSARATMHVWPQCSQFHLQY